MILFLILAVLVYLTAASYTSAMAGIGILVLLVLFGGDRLRNWHILIIGPVTALVTSQVAL